jgi:cell division protein FtsX
MLSLAVAVLAVRLIEPRVAALAAVFGQSLDWPSLPLGFALAFVTAAAVVGWAAGWVGASNAARRFD